MKWECGSLFHSRPSVILSTAIRICGIPKEMVLDTYHSTGRNSNIDSITIKKHVL